MTNDKKFSICSFTRTNISKYPNSDITKHLKHCLRPTIQWKKQLLICYDKNMHAFTKKQKKLFYPYFYHIQNVKKGSRNFNPLSAGIFTVSKGESVTQGSMGSRRSYVLLDFPWLAFI